MKYFRILILFFIVLSFSIVFGQDKEPIGIWGKSGLFIKVTNSLEELRNNKFTINKSLRGNGVETFELNSFPQNLLEFKNRLNHNSLFFHNGIFFENKIIEQIWHQAEKVNNIDSLYYYGVFPVVQLSLGALYLDSNATTGDDVSYTITGTRNNVEISKSNVNIIPFEKSFSLEKINYKDHRSTDSSVTITYKTPEYGIPTIINVYRKQNMQGDYAKLNSEIGMSFSDGFINIFLTDNTISPNNIYEYYLVPFDRFDNIGPNSDTISLGSYNFEQLVIPNDFKAESIDSLHGIKLSWRGLSYQFLKSIKLFRSEIFDSAFTEIAELSSSSNEYIDTFVEPMKKYFYKIQFIGILDEKSQFSARVFSFYKDLSKPDTPYDITVQKVKNGTKISWEDTQSFVKGYYVYRNNGETEELKQISNFINFKDDSVQYFIDSTEIHNKFTYAYSVIVENTSHVQSDFSDTVYISIPNSSLPVPPLNVIVKKDEKFVKIYWDDMRNFNEQLKGYKVFRRSSAKEFIPMTDSLLWSNQNNFTDTSIVLGVEYEYAIKSYTFSNTESEFSQSQNIKIDLPLPLPPANLIGSVEENGIQLSWNIYNPENIKEVSVFRAKRGGKSELLKKINDLTNMEFLDSTVKKGDFYFYFIKTVSKDGIESKISEKIGVQY